MRLNTIAAAACLLAGTATAATEKFKADKDGKYWIYGEGIRAAFIPYGASITDLIVKDQYGIERDVVMGFDNATYYEEDKTHAHLGGIVGRYANRIKNSTFEMDGVKYHVTPNENPTKEHPDGLNQLHGGPDGWDWRTFKVASYTNNSITFSLVDPDGKEGFPGEVVSYVTYTLGKMTWDFKIVAIATTKKTPIHLSNHGYWNLDGFANNETQSVLNHTFYLPYSGQRVDVDNILIPTGDILANKKGSVNDFWSKPKQIASGFKDKEIKDNCGKGCDGYDNCWLVNKPTPDDWRAEGNYVARLQSAWSGIQLDIYSDQEAFQMYSCNFQDGSMTLKKNQGLFDNPDFPRTVPKYGCLVLEVEDWIDAINHPEWHREKKHFIEPGGDPYVVQASYRFSVNSTRVPY